VRPVVEDYSFIERSSISGLNDNESTFSEPSDHQVISLNSMLRHKRFATMIQRKGIESHNGRPFWDVGMMFGTNPEEIIYAPKILAAELGISMNALAKNFNHLGAGRARRMTKVEFSQTFENEVKYEEGKVQVRIWNGMSLDEELLKFHWQQRLAKRTNDVIRSSAGSEAVADLNAEASNDWPNIPPGWMEQSSSDDPWWADDIIRFSVGSEAMADLNAEVSKGWSDDPIDWIDWIAQSFSEYP
jgi:hypothetical protein